MTPELPPRLFGDQSNELDSEQWSSRIVIWERLLENGTSVELRQWLGQQADGELVAWLKQRGDRLSARSWAFWLWLLKGSEAGGSLSVRGGNPWWPDAVGAGSVEEPS